VRAARIECAAGRRIERGICHANEEIGAAGYLADVAAVYGSPSLQSSLGTNFAMAGGLAELAFLLWLVVMGAKEPARESTPKEVLAWSA